MVSLTQIAANLRIANIGAEGMLMKHLNIL